MSFSLTRLIWESAQPAGADRLALLALAYHVNKKDVDTCWPSQATLARECAVQERAMRNTLTRLEAAGYIERRPRGRGTLYRICTEALIPTADCRSREGSTPAVQRTTPAVGRPDAGSPAPEHRQSAAHQLEENQKGEQPTEPIGLVGSPENGSDDPFVSDVIARLHALGVTDPTVPGKVANLTRVYGQDRVAQVLADLEALETPARSPYGWLSAQTKKAASGRHSFKGIARMDLVERERYTDAEKRRSVDAGAPEGCFQKCAEDGRGSPVWMYLPGGPRRAYAPQETADDIRAAALEPPATYGDGTAHADAAMAGAPNLGALAAAIGRRL
ncbi:helix-turn-helix domain-containing protein [Rubrivirga sp. IMCC43871]|uniref:helix-turn-helix domain-containing protein n=1 Tax=Rubrivirga sp. IMCC43871 TaxID=3391575 RepID=UPI00398FD5C4